MNRITAEGKLQEMDFSVVNGYILKDGYRYGRLGQDIIETEETGTEIRLDDIEELETTLDGSVPVLVAVGAHDGKKIELEHTTVIEKGSYVGLVPFIKKHEEKDDKGDVIIKYSNGRATYHMPSSISDLMEAWELIFPDFDQKCWREETTGRIEMDMSLIGESGTRCLEDDMMTRIAGRVQTRLKGLGCIGRQPSKNVIADVFTS